MFGFLRVLCTNVWVERCLHTLQFGLHGWTGFLNDWFKEAVWVRVGFLGEVYL